MKHILAIMAMMALWVSAYADDFADRQAAAVKANPQGIAFTIKLPKESFHTGEVIPVELSFSSTLADHWQLDGGLYDRSGRMHEDAYHVEPTDGVVDPLADYFAFSMGMGGGIRNMPMLGEKPHVMTFELNQWLRFDRPGKYRLYVTSSRIEDLAATQAARQVKTVPATSNDIGFEILPADPAWEKQQLAEIVLILDTEKADDKRRAAAMRLRCLGTADSAAELARRLGADRGSDDAGIGWEFMFGLFGLPDRAAAVAAMQHELVAADHAATSMFSYSLARLKAAGAPPATRPADYRARDNALQKATDEVSRDLLAALPTKRGPARAISIVTLLESTATLDAADRDRLRALVPEIFNELTLEQQCDVLNYRWAVVRSPDLLPMLLAIYRQPPVAGDRDEQQRQTLHDLALWRAYELDPAGTRPLVIDAIGGPGKRFSRLYIRSLLALPDATLPELDEKLAAQLRRDHELDDLDVSTTLIRRYATVAIEPQVKAFYEPSAGRWACAIETELLAYFLRVDPAYGIERVRFVLAARGKENARCWARLISEVGGLQWTRDLERLAVESLTDPVYEVATSAAQALQTHGSPAAKAGLLAALAADWTPDQQDAANHPPSPDPIADRRAAIAWALLNASRYLLDDKDLDQIARVCSDRRTTESVKDYRPLLHAPVPVTLYYSDPQSIQCCLLPWWYSNVDDLHAKMLQFAKGTEFQLDREPNAIAETTAARAALRAWAKEHGLTLTDPPPPADPAP